MAEKKQKKRGRIRRSLSWALKPFINVKAWVAYDSVKGGYNNLNETVNDLFSVAEPEHTETFEEAKQRLNLDNRKLKEQYENFQLMFRVFILIALLLLVLSIYWLFGGGFFGGIFVLILMLVSLGNAFRYHFWMFQIKQQKLGCTVQEWFAATFNKRSKSS